MRILFASSNLPTPPTSGGAQRTELLLRCLQELGTVDCVFLVPEIPSSPQLALLKEHCNVRLILSTHELLHQRYQFLKPKSANSLTAQIRSFIDGGQFRWQAHGPAIKQLGSLDHYDLIVVRYPQVAATLSLFGRRPLALDVDDYDPGRLKLRMTHATPWKRLTLRRCLRNSIAAHRVLLPKADYLWVSNPEDRSHPSLENSALLPNIPYPDKKGNLPITLPFNEHSKRLLTVGSFDYSANLDGVECFLKQVWPHVHAAVPDSGFDIVGKGIDCSRAQKWSKIPGVNIHGFVEDLSEVYRYCLATVAPILAGAGTNIKVLESAAYGRAPLVTRIAHRGYGQSLPDGEACIVVDSIKSMAHECIELLKNPSRAKQIGQSARKFIETHHNFDLFRRKVQEGCEATLRR
jgi:glycosyltransferase involved in cell wall biosynthesis